MSRWAQFVALGLAQLTGRQSLRDIVSNLSTQGRKLYHLGVGTTVSRSSLARVNAEQVLTKAVPRARVDPVRESSPIVRMDLPRRRSPRCASRGLPSCGARGVPPGERRRQRARTAMPGRGGRSFSACPGAFAGRSGPVDVVSARIGRPYG